MCTIVLFNIVRKTKIFAKKNKWVGQKDFKKKERNEKQQKGLLDMNMIDSMNYQYLFTLI